jgi:hypothetical protein
LNTLLSENTALGKLFRPQREEVGGEWRKFHKEELHDLYASPDIRMTKSRRVRWAVHVARIGLHSNAYKILGGKSEGNNSLIRSSHRREENIKIKFI